MEKSKLGISVTFLAAILYLLGFYGGYIVAVVTVGYVLLKEDNLWLKKAAINVIAWLLLFGLASTAINLIPNFLSLIYSIISMFGGSAYFTAVESFFSFLSQILSLGKTVMFILMAALALGHKSILLPGINNLDKYIG